MTAGPDGDPFPDFSELTRDQAAALSEVTIEDFKDGPGEDSHTVRKVKVKLHDKNRALVDIGKHLGMFINRGKLDLKNTDGSLRPPIVIERVIVDPATDGDPGTDNSGDRQI